MAAENEGRGHASRPHTADVVIEAWGPTAAACYEEAVAGFVGLFVDTSHHATTETAQFDLGPAHPEDLLVLLLEEVILIAETRGYVATATHVEVHGDRLVGTFTLARPRPGDLLGSIPKGVSYNDLEFGAAGGGWRCRAIVDV